MDRFDSLLKHLLESYTIEEADLPDPPAVPGAGASLSGSSAVGGAPGGQMPVGTPQQDIPNPPPISPEDNIDNSDKEEKSNLPSQKKLQLIKLIALAISTHSPATKDGAIHSREKQQRLHKARVMLMHDTTEGNASRNENLIIKVIAFMQGVDPKDIAAQIDFITPSYNEKDISSYIAKDEYASLVELAKDAILASPESLSEIDRSSIIASKITSDNADEQLNLIKGAIAQAI